jgi:anti-sigma factor RsiW
MSHPIDRATAVRAKSKADLLQAYYDGELSGFARWRFERRLRRSPALRRELEALSRIGEWVRESHVEAPGLDLWEAIALRLPAADARRASSPARAGGLGWLAWPGMVAATVVLGLVLARGWLEPAAPSAQGIVRWLDSGGRDVMVLEAAPDTTIIWVFDAPGKGARRGSVRAKT